MDYITKIPKTLWYIDPKIKSKIQLTNIVTYKNVGAVKILSTVSFFNFINKL